MQSDLQGLEITQLDLKNLSGIDLGNGVSPTRNIILWITFLLYFPSLFCLAILISIASGILETVTGSKIDNDLGNLVSLVLAFPLARYAAKAILTYFKIIQISPIPKDELEPLLKLKSEIEKFNNIVKAIDVNDQLEEAGNKGLSLQDRDKIIEAIKLAKKDLVRALKTERILRENKGIIISNSELFANNLSTLKALQISGKATEYSQLLNQALQIAVDVQEEMKKLQNQHED
jgi:hypothetical protein